MHGGAVVPSGVPTSADPDPALMLVCCGLKMYSREH